MSRCGATGRPTGSRSPRPPTPCSRPGRRRRRIVVYVDAWTAYGGSQFVDSPGHRPLSLLPLRRGRALGGRAVPDAGRRRPPGDHGQVQRRVRRDDHADAPAGPVRRAGHPRRGFAVRAVLRARVRQGRASPARLRRGHLALVGRLPVAHLVHQGSRPRPAHAARRGRLLLGRAGRHRRAAVRPAHRGAPPAGVAALAGLGPGPDGPALRRPSCGRCGRSGSTPGPGTNGSSTSGRRRSGRRCGRQACPTR